jgi:hypothetical protein
MTSLQKAAVIFAALDFLSGSGAHGASPAGNTPATAASPPTGAAVSPAAPLMLPVSHTEEGCTNDVCTAALTKAIGVITKALSLRPSGLSDTAVTVPEIRKLKSCVNLPDTDTPVAYHGPLNRHQSIYLLMVKGEISKSNVILGPACDAVVAMEPIPAIILSYLVEATSKRAQASVRPAFLPTQSFSAPPNQGSDARIKKVAYKTEIGRIEIEIDHDSRMADGRVVRENGTIIYAEHYELESKQ